MKLTFECAVVDRQSYLDGTHELTLEGEAAGVDASEPWLLTLTLRWPKDEAPDEGDLAITGGGGASLYGGLEGGSIEDTVDDSGDDVLALSLTFTVASADGPLQGPAGVVRVDGQIVGDSATLVLTTA